MPHGIDTWTLDELRVARQANELYLDHHGSENAAPYMRVVLSWINAEIARR
jgi:hypothetical protein